MSSGPAPSTEWTFLLYIGAVNSLGYTAEDTLQWLAGADISPKVAFVYEIGTAADLERGRIYRDGAGKVYREVQSRGPRIDTASEQRITDFVDWGTRTFPSRYTALILKDHGLGLDGPPGWAFMAPPAADGAPSVTGAARVSPRDFMIDVVAQDVLSNRGLRTIIEQSALGRVDLFGLDACELNVLEVLYELRDVASYVVATPLALKENPTFFPYTAAMNALARRPSLGPREVARVLATSNGPARLVATETAWLGELASSIDSVGRALSALLPAKSDAIQHVRLAVGRPGDTVVDLKLLLANLRTAFADDISVPQAVARAEEALARACFAAGPEVSYLGVTLGGTQIFFPTAEGTALWTMYGSLEFARSNRWTTFLAQLCWPSTALY